MQPEHWVTRNHIEVFAQGVLPTGARPIPFWTLMRGSLVPAVLWAGVVGLVSLVVGPGAGAVVCGIFGLFFAVGRPVVSKAKGPEPTRFRALRLRGDYFG
ncbi:hypothetical protein ACH3WN_11025 [Streptomyces albogriseolus]|uniref:hypothetical protein n=1 Tax=Streptomyces albogriseolus TaxID=1887 RepID=UPI003791F889